MLLRVCVCVCVITYVSVFLPFQEQEHPASKTPDSVYPESAPQQQQVGEPGVCEQRNPSSVHSWAGPPHTPDSGLI